MKVITIEEAENHMMFKRFPYYKMVDSVPKNIDLYDNKSCYIWIECFNKKFPAYITPNVGNVKFEYYVNLVHFNEMKHTENFNIGENPIKSERVMENLRLNSFLKMNIKNINFERNFNKPTYTNAHINLIGDRVEISLPTSFTENNIHPSFIVILVKSLKPIRVLFSISFTNPMHVTHRAKDQDPFGKAHKEFLFGPDFEKRERKRFFKNRLCNSIDDKITKNIGIAGMFNDYKEKMIKGAVSKLNLRTKSVRDRFKDIRKEENEKNQ